MARNTRVNEVRTPIVRNLRTNYRSPAKQSNLTFKPGRIGTLIRISILIIWLVLGQRGKKVDIGSIYPRVNGVNRLAQWCALAHLGRCFGKRG